MKGLVFTEFLDHVDDAFGPEMVETVVSTSDLESGGAYTSVGTYKCSELAALIVSLSQTSGAAIDALVFGFGVHLADSFYAQHPEFFKTNSFFDFVESVDNRIHVEVKKLYPDADLPRFLTVSRSPSELVIDYVSQNSLEVLAHGLLHRSAELFGEAVTVSLEPERFDKESRIVRLVIIKS